MAEPRPPYFGDSVWALSQLNTDGERLFAQSLDCIYTLKVTRKFARYGDRQTVKVQIIRAKRTDDGDDCRNWWKNMTNVHLEPPYGHSNGFLMLAADNIRKDPEATTNYVSHPGGLLHRVRVYKSDPDRMTEDDKMNVLRVSRLASKSATNRELPDAVANLISQYGGKRKRTKKKKTKKNKTRKRWKTRNKRRTNARNHR